MAPAAAPAPAPASRSGAQAIPDAVSRRMLRRAALATGIPTLLGMAVFVVSYLLVSRQIVAIPPFATLLTSGGFFLIGLLGLSYSVLSASWEEAPGSVLGLEQVRLNVARVRESLRSRRQAASVGSDR